MAYTVGDTISNSDYNGLLNNTASGTPNAGVAARGINYIAGTGAGEYGLGQTELPSVAAADTIQAAQWNSLFTFMNNIQNHTNISALTSTTAAAAGDVIAIKAALETDLTALAAAVAGGSTGADALTTSAALQTVTTAAEGWDSGSDATQEVSITFGSADKMRWFFNAGGKARITVGIVAAVEQGKDTAFKDLGTAIGNLDIASLTTSRSGTGETLTTNGLALGMRDLTTNYQTLLKLTSDNSTYTSNTVEIFAKLDAAVDSAVTMTIKMVATDGASDAQYTAGNTSSVAAAIKDTPKMVTTLFAVTPNFTQGLTDPTYSITSATVSNTTT
jgi:hypothetical protein